MYTGQRSQSDFSNEWMNKTNAFLKRAFDKAAKFLILVLCGGSSVDVHGTEKSE
jgi:hypothetical protein